MDGYALVTELKNATEDVLATGETFILDDTAGVFQICFVLEKILNNGLKDLALFGKTSFWEFLEHLDQCLPGTTNVLNDIRECSKTPLGRGRVFVRVALNEGAAMDYLKALVWNRELARKYYKDSALMRNDQYFASILSYLEKLSDVKFSLVVKDSGFDDPAYYDKMALELVMSGQRNAANNSGKDLTAIAPTPSQPVPTPAPVQSSYVSAVSSTPVPLPKSQPQTTPAPVLKVEPEAQLSPQTKPPAPVPASPNKETEKKKSPQAKRKTAARSRAIIDTSNDGEAPIDTVEVKYTPPPSAKRQPTKQPVSIALDEPQAEPTPTITVNPVSEPTPIIPEPPAETVEVKDTPASTLVTPATQANTLTPILNDSLSAPTTPTSPADSTQSISDSDLVPVKLHNLRSPHATDTESIFSSAEMLSSQTSTPSFTAVTDDTDFSPLTTPILHNSSSPKLTLNSEHSAISADASMDNASTQFSFESSVDDASKTPEPTPSAEPLSEPLLDIKPYPTPDSTQTQPEPQPEPTSEPAIDTKPHIELTPEEEQKAEIVEPTRIPTPVSEQHEIVHEVEPAKSTTDSWNSYVPPVPTISDFANNELPVEQPAPQAKSSPPPTNDQSPPSGRSVLPPLVEALKRDVYAVLGNNNALIREADALLETLEKILSQGIRSGAMFLHCPSPMDQVWAFVRYLPSYMSGTESLFDEIQSNREIDTDMGRARSWMRAALNHMTLAQHLKVLLADHKRTHEYYDDTALLRSYEHQAMILVLIDSLSSGRFCLQTHDEYIDIADKKNADKRSSFGAVMVDKKQKKRIVSMRKKASIESSDGSDTVEAGDEEVVVTRRRGSSASRTKRPNFLNSAEAVLMSSTAPTYTHAALSITPPAPSAPSAPSVPTLTPTPVQSSVVSEPVRPPSPKKEEPTELPPMPQVPSSEFVPIGADLFQKLQQLPEAPDQNTPPNPTPPVGSSLSSTPSTSLSSSPTYTSFDDLPRTIPFGVPGYEPDFAPPENYRMQTYSPIDIPARPARETVPFFQTPLSASYMPSSSSSIDSGSNTPLSYSYSASVSDDTRVTVSDGFLQARMSDDYEPRSMSKALDVVRPKSKKMERRPSLTDIDSDDGSNAGSQVFGTTPESEIAPLPTHYILDITRKVQRNTKCPGCNAAISHGLFSAARLCSYYSAYYCGKCHTGDEAVIPARLVHQLDVKPYPVCSEARGHIHQYYRSPQLNMRVLNPSAYRYSSTLDKAGKLRRQLKYLGDYVKTCRNKETLLNLMDGRQYMLDSLYVYSLRDLIDAISGPLLPFMYNIMEKFITHVTKTCDTCKGKGFYCEYCNSGDLLFSWMVLRSSDCRVCPKCKSLSHTQCFKKGNGDCPKCKRIALLKAKPTIPASVLT